MTDLLLDGVDVRSSGLTQRPYRAASMPDVKWTHGRHDDV